MLKNGWEIIWDLGLIFCGSLLCAHNLGFVVGLGILMICLGFYKL